jgi:DNA-binding NarL/FixJ family response regulator
VQVLECLTEGLSNKEISEKLKIAEGTVKVHVSAVYQALRVESRTAAVRAASHYGLIGIVQSVFP